MSEDPYAALARFANNQLQAASDAQLQMLNTGAAQASFDQLSNLYGMHALANFRPWPPQVPQGWADWFAHGDELQ